MKTIANQQFYQPTTFTPVPNKIAFIAITLFLIILLGTLYGVVSAVSPLIYMSFVAMVIYGMALAFVFRLAAKMTLIRSKKFKQITAGLVGLVGIYFSWVSFLHYLFQEQSYFESVLNNLDLYYNLPVTFTIIFELSKEGLWSIIGEAPVSGLPLQLIWLAEALIIMFIPFYMLNRQHLAPFSELHNKWYNKFVLNKDFETLVDIDQFLAEEDKLEFISGLKNGSNLRFARISVFYIEKETIQYLLIEHVLRDRDGKNESSTIKVDNLAIPNELAQQLIAKFHAKKQFFFDY